VSAGVTVCVWLITRHALQSVADGLSSQMQLQSVYHIHNITRVGATHVAGQDFAEKQQGVAPAKNQCWHKLWSPSLLSSILATIVVILDLVHVTLIGTIILVVRMM